MSKTPALFLKLALAAAALALTGLAAAQPSDYARIMETKLVRIGAVSAPPWYNKDLMTNRWVGLVPDVMEKIFAKAGVKIEYVDTQWGTAVAGLQSNRFDLLGAYNETPERAKAIDFTRPIGSLKMAVLTHGADPSKYATWAQINTPSVRLSAIDGAGATVLLKPVLTNTNWVFAQSSDAMFLELESGRADALITSDVQITQYLLQRRKGTMVVPTPVYSQPTNIALRKNADELKAFLNKSLDELAASGALDQIWAKYVEGGAKK